MKVASANICLDDDTLFVGDECPQCFGHSYYPLRKWLSPLHSFNEIKEVHYAKRNLPIQKRRKEGLCSFNNLDITIVEHSKSFGPLDKRIHTRNKGPIIRDYKKEPLSAPTGKGHYPGGKQLESESYILGGGHRSDANHAVVSIIDSWIQKIRAVLPRNKHNRRVQNPKALPTNKSKSPGSTV